MELFAALPVYGGGVHSLGEVPCPVPFCVAVDVWLGSVCFLFSAATAIPAEGDVAVVSNLVFSDHVAYFESSIFALWI